MDLTVSALLGWAGIPQCVTDTHDFTLFYTVHVEIMHGPIPHPRNVTTYLKDSYLV